MSSSMLRVSLNILSFFRGVTTEVRPLRCGELVMSQCVTLVTLEITLPTRLVL